MRFPSTLLRHEGNVWPSERCAVLVKVLIKRDRLCICYILSCLLMFSCLYNYSGSGSIKTCPRDGTNRRGGGQGSFVSFSEKRRRSTARRLLVVVVRVAVPSVPPILLLPLLVPPPIRIHHVISLS